MSFAERSEYKGNPMLVLKNDENDRYPFSFGLKKAKLLLQHIEDVKKFVEDNVKADPGEPAEPKE